MLRVGQTEQEQFEKIPVRVFERAETACASVASDIAALIRSKAAAGENAVLGLATGSTPVGLYRELIRLHREEGLSFTNVTTFNLDEYYGLGRSHPESYWRFMHDQLFDHIDIPASQVNIPDGTVARQDVFAHCRSYEEAIVRAGGIDLQILGIGRTGHIGFNEPGSGADSRTRLVTLDTMTRRDAARDFLGEENVPRHAITMGVGTILEARKLVLLAWGEAKADVVARAVEEVACAELPASFLQSHPDCRFFVDNAAAKKLARFDEPWRVGVVDWNASLRRKAVVWLTARVGKPILKLVDEDYAKHSLSDLITGHGPAYDLNVAVFNEAQHSITGWPGGKPGADDSTRPERAEPAVKRVLVLGPEPLDVERSMGGTLHRLIDQGHEVTLAYMTSGNLAVPDPLVRLAVDLAQGMAGDGSASEAMVCTVREQLSAKKEFDIDSPEIRRVKSLIRRGESLAAAETLGLARERVRFLNLPFYESGRYRQFLPGSADEEVLASLIEKLRPHQIFASGVDSAPGSVAAVCFEVLRCAWRRLSGAKWMEHCRLWIYPEIDRAWPLHDIDMAVPLSPVEMKNKLEAVYQHQSQRSQTPSSNEAWQETGTLDRATAAAFDRLGLAEYEAMETFRRMDAILRP
ncbi:MAG: glucosamine-6-phosphate deaminase [Chthoniobacterales bacterium]|nr:glucosamine-6-phosphate deaminase [Chthoniobacterales bacterium]